MGLWPAGAAVAHAGPEPVASTSHSFDLTYCDFGPVRVTSGFRPTGPVLVRFEGCYARGGPEAICGFTLRARTGVTISNLRNLSHGTRVGGSPMRTCCLFRQGRPEGFPIVATGDVAGAVADLAAELGPGQEFGVMLRLPDYRTGPSLRSITFSRGGGDPGVTFPAEVRDLPDRSTADPRS